MKSLGSLPSRAEKDRIPTVDQDAAFDAASPPLSGANPAVSDSDSRLAAEPYGFVCYGGSYGGWWADGSPGEQGNPVPCSVSPIAYAHGDITARTFRFTPYSNSTTVVYVAPSGSTGVEALGSVSAFHPPDAILSIAGSVNYPWTMLLRTTETGTSLFSIPFGHSGNSWYGSVCGSGASSAFASVSNGMQATLPFACTLTGISASDLGSTTNVGAVKNGASLFTFQPGQLGNATASVGAYAFAAGDRASWSCTLASPTLGFLLFEPNDGKKYYVLAFGGSNPNSGYYFRPWAHSAEAMLTSAGLYGRLYVPLAGTIKYWSWSTANVFGPEGLYLKKNGSTVATANWTINNDYRSASIAVTEGDYLELQQQSGPQGVITLIFVEV